VVGDEAIRVAGSRFGIVFSGSPRTMYEAFEGPLAYRKKKHRGLVELLFALYGKERVSVAQLKVCTGTSLKRNSVRRLCAECGLPMMGHVRHSPPHCPFCGGSMRRRILDDPKIIAVRVKEYEERTLPIVKEMRRRGIRVMTVDGEEAPYRVSRAIARRLGFQAHGST
jgi:adenylate kinase family enzyme